MRYDYFLKKHFPSPKEQKWAGEGFTLAVENGKVVSDKDYVICLEKDPNKDFVILNLTDIQLRLPELRLDADCVAIAEKTVKKLVKKVKPDLITVTGDQGFGDRTEILRVGGMIDRFGIPWAPVFGNADNRADEGLPTAQQTFLYENAFKNCLLKAGPSDLAYLVDGQTRYGNYVVNIVERGEKNSFTVVRSLIFMNSGDEEPYDDADYPGQERANKDEYSHLTARQLEWYRMMVRSAQKYGNGKVSSSLFLHIPIYAYNDAYKAAKNENGEWNPGYEDSVGEVREVSGTPPYDDGVLAVLKEEGSTDFIICGHDHRNNSIVKHDGITYCYGLKTGKGCYWDKDMSGGTVVTIKKDGAVSARHEYCPVKVIGIPRWIYPAAALLGSAIIGLLIGLLS